MRPVKPVKSIWRGRVMVWVSDCSWCSPESFQTLCLAPLSLWSILVQPPSKHLTSIALLEVYNGEMAPIKTANSVNISTSTILFCTFTTVFSCGRRPTGHRVIPVVVVVVVGIGAETTFKPMYDVWVSSEKPLFFPKPIYDFGAHVWFWYTRMILVPMYDFGAHVCSL